MVVAASQFCSSIESSQHARDARESQRVGPTTARSALPEPPARANSPKMLPTDCVQHFCVRAALIPGMTNEIRQPQGQPAGGQFAGHNRTEATTTLNEQRPVRVPVLASAAVSTYEGSPLPGFPAGLSEPKVTFDVSDDGVIVYGNIEGDGYHVSVRHDGYKWCNSVLDDGEPSGVEEEDEEKLLYWAQEVTVRLESGVRALQTAAFTRSASDAVVAAALGHDRVEVGNRAQSSDTDNNSTSESGAKRGAAILAAFGGERDPEASMSDILTDLMHYAHENDLDMDELVRSAHMHSDAELREAQEQPAP